MNSDSKQAGAARQNPLIWVAVVAIGLIAFVIFGGERGVAPGAGGESAAAGTIDRSLLVPPGMRARELIRQLRDDGTPYPLDVVFDKAGEYLDEGSLADAHLLYFFAARENHLPSIMVMGEMSDPTRFEAGNSLLDHADVIQAYKWYEKASSMGHQAAASRLDGLQQWAVAESRDGNPHARQLLLNFQ